MKKRCKKYLEEHVKNDLSDKTIIITGGNSGIGLESAKICAYLKMHVIIAVRSLFRGNEAIKIIKREVPDANIDMMELDVSKSESIVKFVNEIKEKRIDIDCFYHNAGIYRQPYQEVENGLDLMLFTNYYGPFKLTSLLLDYLHSLNHEVDMVFTSSVAPRWSKRDEHFLAPTKDDSRSVRYGNTKLLDAYLFKYLFENDESNVKYYLVHPGTAATALIRKNYPSVAALFVKTFGNPIWKSALPIAVVLSDESKPGEFYGPTKIWNLKGYPKENHFLDKYYENIDEVIHQTEDILDIKLLA